MNREICFRGKRIDNGEWVYGFYCKHDTVKVCFSSDDPKTKQLIIVDGFCDWGFEPPLQGIEVDPATVGQYAGWNDRYCNEVFEGDIVRGFNDLHQRQETYLVKWCCNNGFYLIDNLGVDWHPEHVENQEIIGNIHDQLSLLQG